MERKGDPRLLVVATDRLEPLKDALGEMKVLGKLSGEPYRKARQNELLNGPCDEQGRTSSALNTSTCSGNLPCRLQKSFSQST